MKKVFAYLMTLMFVLSIFSCGPTKKLLVNEYDNQMVNAFEGYYTEYQLDSICRVDSISRDFNSWIFLPLRDDETQQDVSQYMYIKSLGEYECIYRVQIMGDGTYKITKRITK